MKRLPLIFVIMACCVALVGFSINSLAESSRPALPPDEVSGVLQEAFPEFQKAVKREPKKYGFANANEVDRATVDVGYPIYIIEEKNLTADFFGNIYQLEQYGYAWEFVVSDANNVPRTYLEISYDEQDKRFYMSRFGGDVQPLQAGTEAMLRFAKDRANNIHFVKFAGERLLVFEFEKEAGKPAPYVVPLNEETTASQSPLDYRQTVEYLKKIAGLEYDEQLLGTENNISGSTLIWIALFILFMFIVVRVTNTRLRKERERQHAAEVERLKRRK